MGLAGLLQHFVFFFIDIAFNTDDLVKMKNTFLDSPRVLSIDGELEKLQIASGEEDCSDQLKCDDAAALKKQRERARDLKRSDSRKKMRKQGFLHFLNHSIAH